MIYDMIILVKEGYEVFGLVLSLGLWLDNL